MSNPNGEPEGLTRRQMLARTAAWLGAALSASQVEALAELAATPGPGPAPAFLDRERFATLTAAIDVLLPETDTPGAVSADVHKFIDRMLAEWASDDRRARWLAGLRDFDRRAQSAGAASFPELAADERRAVLQSIDDAAYGPDAPDGFYREFKKMVLFGFCSSEAGATQALRYQRLPGDFQACLPYAYGDGSWFWNGYDYGL